LTSRATCTRALTRPLGFSPEGLRRLGPIVDLDEVIDEMEIDGHPRILALLRAAG
jgi:hypothetical protein